MSRGGLIGLSFTIVSVIVVIAVMQTNLLDRIDFLRSTLSESRGAIEKLREDLEAEAQQRRVLERELAQLKEISTTETILDNARKLEESGRGRPLSDREKGLIRVLHAYLQCVSGGGTFDYQRLVCRFPAPPPWNGPTPLREEPP